MQARRYTISPGLGNDVVHLVQTERLLRRWQTTCKDLKAFWRFGLQGQYTVGLFMNFNMLALTNVQLFQHFTPQSDLAFESDFQNAHGHVSSDVNLHCYMTELESSFFLGPWRCKANYGTNNSFNLI